MEDILKGATAGFLGLGSQGFLPLSSQMPLTHFNLIMFALTIPIVYYAVKLLFWSIKGLSEALKNFEPKKKKRFTK